MIRQANFADIPALAKLQQDSYHRSIYAGRATFDERAAKRTIMAALQRQGHDTEGGSLVLVSEKGGKVCGLMIGILDRIYPCLTELVATDLMFVFADDAEPSDAVKMVKMLMAWAQKNPRVIEVLLGAANTMGDDFERVGALYERCGLTRSGAMFQKGIER